MRNRGFTIVEIMVALFIAAIMFAPVMHRIFHRFHIEAEESAAHRDHRASR